MEKPRNPDEIELAGNDSDNKNWRGILIALLVIVIICGLVIVAVVLVTPRDEEKELGEPFALNDLFSPNFTVQSFAGTWMGGDVDVLVYRAANGDLMELDADKNETRVFVEASVLQQRRNVEKFFVSADLRYILLAYDVEQLYQHSFLARYEIYDRHSTSSENKLLKFPMSDSDKWKTRKLQYAGWSPRDHSLTFVYGNNLYFQASPTTTAFWVTDNSNSKYILNGIPDWLYEEEILHSNVAHWLSPDNRYVAYIQFNDTNVPLHRYPVYGDANDVYGSISEISYPKAGDPNGGINPVVRLFVAEVGNIKGVHRAFAPPAMIQQHQQQDHYITLVQWKDEAHVLVAWSNRAQDTTIMTICVISSQECSENLIERQHKGWVVVNSAKFIKTRKETVYLTILPIQVGDKGYWKHVASVSARMHSEGVKSFLTNGEWEVSEIVGYNEEELTVYFIGPYEKARQRHLFSLKLSPDGRKALGYPHCVTCTGDGQCTYVHARFSQSGRYYVEECLGPGVPYYTLRSTVNNDTAVLLEDNALLRANLARKALPKKETFSFTTDNDEKLQGQILLPPTLRKDHITLYPLLIHTYAGPGTQLVTERFTLDWSTYLVSSENVIYASIDGRGSGGRGDRFLHAVDHALGTVEVQDQIRGAGYLNESQFVDKDRIAIWGWSYGGFVVAHVLGDKDDALFRCGIAIAPITDWRYYDTAYTERYMGMATSTDNYRGYDNANVSSKAANFKGKGFLLVHGTADDNVHFQHSAQLMKALTEAGVLFQSQVYADGRHRLTAGDQTTRHLYRTMTKFLQKECWGGGKPQEAKPVATETNQKQQKGKS